MTLLCSLTILLCYTMGVVADPPPSLYLAPLSAYFPLVYPMGWPSWIVQYFQNGSFPELVLVDEFFFLWVGMVLEVSRVNLRVVSLRIKNIRVNPCSALRAPTTPVNTLSSCCMLMVSEIIHNKNSSTPIAFHYICLHFPEVK